MKTIDERQHPAKEELRSLLERVARYFGLTTQAIGELVRRARIEHPVQTLCVSGDRDDLVNLVLRGVVRVKLFICRLARRHGTAHPRGTLLDIRLRDADIARLVGATRCSVNRCMKSLQRGGMLERLADRILLLDPPPRDVRALPGEVRP